MFNYCTKENINLIFHLGDFFEGIIPGSLDKQKYTSTNEQIERVLSNYPSVDNILTITLLGNHDASFWLDAGIDIKTILENRRHDIIPIGYEKGIVNINDYNFLMNHPIGRVHCDNLEETKSSQIFLNGHSHRFKIINRPKKITIFVPSSSNMKNDNNELFLGTGIPSIIDAEFNIKGTTKNNIIIKQYILYNNELIKIGEFEENTQISQFPNNQGETEQKPNFYTCFSERNNTNEKTKLSSEQTMSEEQPNTETNMFGTKKNKYRGLSRIEKFFTRYKKDDTE